MFFAMNNAGEEALGREELPRAPGPFPARLLLSTKPPS